MKCGEVRCRNCKRNALECGSWLRAVKGRPGEWECAYPCEEKWMVSKDRLLGAIEDK